MDAPVKARECVIGREDRLRVCAAEGHHVCEERTRAGQDFGSEIVVKVEFDMLAPGMIEPA
jgi:hypothetical protein